MTTDIVSCGETMGLLDSERIGPLRLGGSMRLSMAGAESTVAIGVARLGGAARWVGVVGDDEIGDLITRILRAERVQTDGVVVHPEAPTGPLLNERRTSAARGSPTTGPDSLVRACAPRTSDTTTLLRLAPCMSPESLRLFHLALAMPRSTLSRSRKAPARCGRST